MNLALMYLFDKKIFEDESRDLPNPDIIHHNLLSIMELLLEVHFVS